MSKKSLIALLLITVSLLAGCGGGEQPQQAPAGSTTSNTSAEATTLAAADATAQAAIDSGSAESAETAVAAAIETEVAINDKKVANATTPATVGGGIDLTNVDPCTMLTRAEVEEIVGPLEWSPRPATDAINGGKRCDLAPGMKVILSVGQPEMYEREAVTSLRSGDISGLGDEAFASERCVNALLRGKAAVHVCIFDFSGPFNQDHATQLARMLIERLP